MGIIRQTKTLYSLAKNMKTLKGGDSLERQKAKRYIQRLVQDQGGLYLKVLQYMGTQNADLSSIAYDDITGIAREDVKEIIKSVFPHFYGEILETSFAASIGQVNLGKLDGKDIAIKIRYPKIKETLEEQLRLIKLIPSLQGVSPTKKWGFDFMPYQEAIQKMLEQECDLSKEANELKAWEEYLKNFEGARVPRVLSDFISSEAYVQEFVSGQTAMEVAKSAQAKEKRQLAERLVSSFLFLMLRHGKMQGDSNFGNFLFNIEPLEVIYLDLGQVINFEERFRKTILNALALRVDGKRFDTLRFFEGLGFDVKKLEPIEKRLDLLVTILLEPISSNRPVNLNNWSYKKEIDTLLGEEKWWFRSAGGTEFFLFMKGFLGLKNLLNLWNVNLNWNQIIKELLAREELDPEMIPEYQERRKVSEDQFHGDNIQVRVMDGDEEKVKLTMPFMTIFDLEDYIDQEVKILIEKEGYDLGQIVRDALLDGGKPKEIINIKKGHKTYFVAIV